MGRVGGKVKTLMLIFIDTIALSQGLSHKAAPEAMGSKDAALAIALIKVPK